MRPEFFKFHSKGNPYFRNQLWSCLKIKEEACLWASSQAAGRDYQHLEMYFKKLIRIWKTVHTHSLWLHPPKSVWQSSEAWLSPGPVQTTIKVLLFDYTKWYLIPQRRWKAITFATYLWTELCLPPHSHLMMQKKNMVSVQHLEDSTHHKLPYAGVWLHVY